MTRHSPLLLVTAAFAATSAATWARAEITPSIPSPAAASAAFAAYARGAWRYEGTVQGGGLSGRLALSFSERPGGVVAGEALLLDPQSRLVAASSVSGRIDGVTCRLHTTLLGRSRSLDGICSPSLVGGRIISDPPRPDLLRRVALWWDDQALDGEAWLSPSAGL